MQISRDKRSRNRGYIDAETPEAVLSLLTSYLISPKSLPTGVGEQVIVVGLNNKPLDSAKDLNVIDSTICCREVAVLHLRPSANSEGLTNTSFLSSYPKILIDPTGKVDARIDHQALDSALGCRGNGICIANRR